MHDETRRRFMAHFAGIGLGSTLVPGVLWARMQDAGASQLTLAMVTDALKLSGVELSEDDRRQMVESANRNLTSVQEIRKISIPLDVSPPYHFSAIVPGVQVNKTKMPFRMSVVNGIKRPAALEDVAFWPVRHLAELVRTRQVSSLELTDMYLSRLHRYNGLLNNVVTFLDDYGREEARRADAEIAAGRYRGPLHGIPWGAKDIISVKGFRTTWGSPAFKDQVFDYDASVIEMLREAGAVLIAKLTTGELAAGDNWFGGQTKSPWDPTLGSSGSSAGPGSATAAGCVGFAIGTETSGSILSPAARNGLAALRPTFGRISRHGCMALSWTQDRLGPMVRYAEDAALVMQAVAKPDGRDMSVSDVPFNWNAQVDIRKLRVGYIKESFDEITNSTVKANAQSVLDTLKTLGVREFVPMTIPESYNNVSAINVESAAYFDELQRSGRMRQTRSARPTGRLVSAVDFLQSQRVRMMMMIDLAKATEGFDVYLVASNNNPGAPGAAGGRGGPGAGPGGGAGGGAGAAGEPGAGGRGAGGRGGFGGGNAPQGPAQRHSTMANLACYPAMNVPNGFSEHGSPTNVTFFGRPFMETEIIALAKAYQDAAGHHLKKPAKLEVVTTE